MYARHGICSEPAGALRNGWTGARIGPVANHGPTECAWGITQGEWQSVVESRGVLVCSEEGSMWQERVSPNPALVRRLLRGRDSKCKDFVL